MISVGFNCYGENDNLMIERYKYLYRSYISIHHQNYLLKEKIIIGGVLYGISALFSLFISNPFLMMI